MIDTKKQKLLLERIKANTRQTPVWMMRQAGRYLPEYLELKKNHSFLELCKSPELAREISLQPLRRFDVDAVICFSDILVIPEAMGMELDFQPAPIFKSPLKDYTDFSRLEFDNIKERVSHILDTLRLLKKDLEDTDKALIGFSGAPYTLFSYMLEKKGYKQFEAPRIFAWQNPGKFTEIMFKLAEIVTEYLLAQHEAGADLLQIFDTWAGTLSNTEYEQFLLPSMRQITNTLREKNIPVAIYVNGCSHLLDKLILTNPHVLSVDWRLELSEYLKQIPTGIAVQGNLDPTVLFGTVESVRQKTLSIISQAAQRKNHILNLGHGILPKTPIENVEAFVQIAKTS